MSGSQIGMPLLTSDWAYLIIAWSLVLILTVYAVFMSLNIAVTPRLDEIAVITDKRAGIYPIDPSMEMHTLNGTDIVASGRSGGPLCDDIYDISPGVISRALYT